MVYFMENPIKHGMIWGYHYFWKHPFLFFLWKDSDVLDVGKLTALESFKFLIMENDVRPLDLLMQ